MMKIALIFNKDRADTTGCYYEKALKTGGFEFAHFAAREADKIEEEFNLYLRIDHGDYKYDIPEKLHPAAFLAIDTHLKKPYKKILRQARHYDFIFAAQKEGAVKLSRALRKEVNWVPLACDPEIHKRLNVEKKYPVGFVGSLSKEGSYRHRLLTEVRSKFPQSFVGTAPYTQMSEIYSFSKIGINYSLNNDVNMRVFEILSCGAMLITSKIKNNGLEDLFVEGRHLVTYDTKEQLVRLIEYYLAHEPERREIAEAGYRQAVNFHTYAGRLKKMFEVIRNSAPVKGGNLIL